MGFWNYRVLRKNHPEGITTYHVHEVTYDDDGSIMGWSVEPVEPFGESVEDLQADVHYFLQAFRRPILKEEIADGKPVLVEADDAYNEINQGHYLELLDRVWVTLTHLYIFIGAHPLLRTNEHLQTLYDEADDALNDLYQAIGQLDVKKEDHSGRS
jgi:hypothetical protein